MTLLTSGLSQQQPRESPKMTSSLQGKKNRRRNVLMSDSEDEEESEPVVSVGKRSVVEDGRLAVPRKKRARPDSESVGTRGMDGEDEIESKASRGPVDASLVSTKASPREESSSIVAVQSSTATIPKKKPSIPNIESTTVTHSLKATSSTSVVDGSVFKGRPGESNSADRGAASTSSRPLAHMARPPNAPSFSAPPASSSLTTSSSTIKTLKAHPTEGIKNPPQDPIKNNSSAAATGQIARDRPPDVSLGPASADLKRPITQTGVVAKAGGDAKEAKTLSASLLQELLLNQLCRDLRNDDRFTLPPHFRKHASLTSAATNAVGYYAHHRMTAPPTIPAVDYQASFLRPPPPTQPTSKQRSKAHATPTSPSHLTSPAVGQSLDSAVDLTGSNQDSSKQRETQEWLERYDFFDSSEKEEFFRKLTRSGSITSSLVWARRVPIFPEDFSPGAKQHPLSWWGIEDIPRGERKFAQPPTKATTSGNSQPIQAPSSDSPAATHPSISVEKRPPEDQRRTSHSVPSQRDDRSKNSSSGNAPQQRGRDPSQSMRKDGRSGSLDRSEGPHRHRSYQSSSQPSYRGHNDRDARRSR
jgi:hypothetical protein